MPNLTGFLLGICIILSVTRLIGRLFRRFGQPRIIGDMTAGILLGPSFFGWLAPDLMAALFPPRSLDYLYAVSQVGLLLYMFVVGMNLNAAALRERRHTVALTSLGSIIFPFTLGTLLALYLHARLSDHSVPLVPFALFMGTAMSVTAFPVLARILSEHNLLRSEVGAVALCCAAVTDVTGWLLLAAITLYMYALHELSKLWWILLGLAAYFGVMRFVARPWLLRLRDRRREGQLTEGMFAVSLLLLLGSALTTEWLGTHALFGAFFAGHVMPKDERLASGLTEKIEPLAVGLLLPIFFALTGLRTSIALVRGAEMWLYFGLVLVVAVAGKVGGSLISARLTGMSWRDAGALGVLLNTRGLIELVILNIGFDLGIIPASLFSMMVLVALITTFMTSPLLTLIYGSHPVRQGAPALVDKG